MSAFNYEHIKQIAITLFATKEYTPPPSFGFHLAYTSSHGLLS